jgi:hypothetical protein
MFLDRDDDLKFFNALIDFTLLAKTTYSDDFSQGFIKESEYQKLLHKMLVSSSLEREVGFGNINVGQIVISKDKLYIDKILFKRESDNKMSSPYAIFIKNSNKPVRYYNYYVDRLGNFKFRQQRDLIDIMTEFGLTREEAEAYEKISRDETQDLNEKEKEC